ncbi:MAG TPA: hypothetical protein VES38_08735 [Methylotenera sp.]|nr:hypothetical protein [Methylotenera sp.]
MADTKAWILQFDSQHRAAVGQRELLHLDQAASRYPFPLAPAHCREVIYWQGRPIPLMDIAIWLGNSKSNLDMERQKYIGIVGYQTRQGETPQFGALWLAQPPSLIIVSDNQACDLSKAGMEWSPLATACFNHEHDTSEHEPVPVLDLMRIFAPNADGMHKAQLKSPAYELTP